VYEPSSMQQNLVDQAYELLRWLQVTGTTIQKATENDTIEQFWGCVSECVDS